MLPALLGWGHPPLKANGARRHPSVIHGGQCPPNIKLKTGDAQLANRILSSLEAVTAEDILRVARTYLREDNRTVVLLEPVTPEASAALGPLQ